MNRRQLIKSSGLLGMMAGTGFLNELLASGRAKKMQIGACDWSIGKDSDVAAFEVAKKIGLDGIQVNLGSVANNLHLRNSELQSRYLEASKTSGVKISSLAIGELNNVPYKSDPRTDEWVWDSIDVAKNLGVSVVLLAFFAKNDLRNDERGKKEIVRKLKSAAPKAEKMGITLGIESYLSAEEHMEIINAVGSESIKVYYDFRNSADAGYDVIREIKWLGKDMICELHMKENGHLLGKGTLDWPKIIHALLEMEYYGDGWMQIEWAKPGDADVIESYKHNMNFLKKLFNY